MTHRTQQTRFHDGHMRPRSIALRREEGADSAFLAVLFGCLGVTVAASLLIQAFGG